MERLNGSSADRNSSQDGQCDGVTHFHRFLPLQRSIPADRLDHTPLASCSGCHLPHERCHLTPMFAARITLAIVCSNGDERPRSAATIHPLFALPSVAE